MDSEKPENQSQEMSQSERSGVKKVKNPFRFRGSSGPLTVDELARLSTLRKGRRLEKAINIVNEVEPTSSQEGEIKAAIEATDKIDQKLNLPKDPSKK